MVNSFLYSFTNYFDNRLLSNNLIIVRNHEDDKENEWEGAGEARRCAQQGGDQIQFKILEFDFKSNSGPGPPRLQINVQNTYGIRFGHFTYA
jgi:hypothetical protein